MGVPGCEGQTDSVPAAAVPTPLGRRAIAFGREFDTVRRKAARRQVKYYNTVRLLGADFVKTQNVTAQVQLDMRVSGVSQASNDSGRESGGLHGCCRGFWLGGRTVGVARGECDLEGDDRAAERGDRRAGSSDRRVGTPPRSRQQQQQQAAIQRGVEEAGSGRELARAIGQEDGGPEGSSGRHSASGSDT